MNRNYRAGVFATAATAVSVVLFFVPVANFLVFIALMIPLWALDNLRLVDLGREQNGFFEPNAVGYVVGIMICWTLCFAFFRALFRGEE